MKEPFYVFDLDGTLADLSHRRSFVERPRGERDYRAFYAACASDAPIWPVIHALQAHTTAGHRVEIWSARSDETREVTLLWLESHGIPKHLLTRMRKFGDTRPDTVVKLEWLAECGDDRPIAIYDDRPRLVRAWRSAGVRCFQVDEGAWDNTAVEQIKPIGRPVELHLMVGPAGAGKSRYVEANFEPSMVLSSDALRVHLTGERGNATRDEEVFSIIRRMTRERLMCGLSTVIDATHLRRKTRVEHAMLAPAGVPVIYVVIDRPISEKARDGTWRNDVTINLGRGHGDSPVTLIEKHDMHFKSELKSILAGDELKHVLVRDMRHDKRAAA